MSTGKPDDFWCSLLGRFGSLSPELSKRIVSGIAIGVVALLMTYWSPVLFAVLMFVIAAAMSFEWGRIVRRSAMPDTGMIVHILAVLLATVLSATDMAGAQEKSRPEIWIISNVVENGKPIGALGDKEAEWHTDMSYVDEPPMASVLHSLEIPKAGGDTSFANMYKALETLPADLRRAIEGRVCNHDASTTSVISALP